MRTRLTRSVRRQLLLVATAGVLMSSGCGLYRIPAYSTVVITALSAFYYFTDGLPD